jgi:hypothetical protein
MLPEFLFSGQCVSNIVQHFLKRGALITVRTDIDDFSSKSCAELVLLQEVAQSFVVHRTQLYEQLNFDLHLYVAWVAANHLLVSNQH